MSSTHRYLKQKVKTAKGRKKSSTSWINRHINDPYVQLAKKSSYRSRAAFKLLEIEEKFNFIRSASKIIDIGAAPGGWLQILKEKSKNFAKIIGVDLLETDPIEGALILQGDFLEEVTQNKIISILNNSFFDLIVSDMAVNSCGDRRVDNLRNSVLVEEVLNFSSKYLKIGGNLVSKSIRGGEEQNLLELAKKQFSKVKLFKPKASYSDSAEIYIIGINKRV